MFRCKTVGVSGGWSDSADDPRADGRAIVAAHKAVIAAVEAWGCGRPVAEIEARLVRELRARHEFMEPDEINLDARQISDPDWPVKDPETARRLVAEMRTPEKRAAESAFRQQWERTTERLAEALNSMRRVRRSTISSRRIMDGVEFEIRIDPWSRRRALKLQRIAAPAVVLVRPYVPS
jgi:hypothetical protein